MTIILELAAPGSPQWRLLDRGSAPLWVLRTFADMSDCILHGLFVHRRAWRAQFLFLLPKGEGKPSAGHPQSPSGFWEHSQVPLRFGIPFCPWASITPEQGSSQVTHWSGYGCSCASDTSTHYKGKKLFPDFTPTSQTSGSCSNHSYPHVPFYVQAVGCQPFCGGESSGWEARKPAFCPHLGTPLLSLLLWCVPSWRTISCLHWDQGHCMKWNKWLLLQYKYFFRAWTSL